MCEKHKCYQIFQNKNFSFKISEWKYSKQNRYFLSNYFQQNLLHGENLKEND